LTVLLWQQVQTIRFVCKMLELSTWTWVILLAIAAPAHPAI